MKHKAYSAETLLRDGIIEATNRIVNEELRVVKDTIERRIREVTASISATIADEMKIERKNNDLVITIKFWASEAV